MQHRNGMGNKEYLQQHRDAAQKRFNETIRKTSALIHDLKVLDQKRQSAQLAMDRYDQEITEIEQGIRPTLIDPVATDEYSKALIEDSEGRLPWGLGSK